MESRSAATKLGATLDQVVAATKIEQRDTRPPLQCGSWGLNGGVCTCYALEGQGWSEVRRGGCPIHGHLESFAVIPLDAWQALVNAVREVEASV